MFARPVMFAPDALDCTLTGFAQRTGDVVGGITVSVSIQRN